MIINRIHAAGRKHERTRSAVDKGESGGNKSENAKGGYEGMREENFLPYEKATLATLE